MVFICFCCSRVSKGLTPLKVSTTIHLGTSSCALAPRPEPQLLTLCASSPDRLPCIGTILSIRHLRSVIGAEHEGLHPNEFMRADGINSCGHRFLGEIEAKHEYRKQKSKGCEGIIKTRTTSPDKHDMTTEETQA